MKDEKEGEKMKVGKAILILAFVSGYVSGIIRRIKNSVANDD